MNDIETSNEAEPKSGHRTIAQLLAVYLSSDEGVRRRESCTLTTNAILEALGVEVNLRNVVLLHKLMRKLFVQRNVDGARFWQLSDAAAATDVIEEDPIFDLVNTWLTTQSAEAFPITSMTIAEAIGLDHSNLTLQRIRLVMRELGFELRNFELEDKRRVVGWQRLPRFKSGELVEVIEGPFKGSSGRVRATHFLPKHIWYELDSIEDTLFKESQLAPPGDGSTAEPEALTAPTLLGALTQWLGWLFEPLTIANLLSLRRAHAGTTKGEWFARTSMLVAMLKSIFRRHQVDTVDALFVAMYERIVLGLPTANRLNLAALTVARVRGEFGTVEDFARPPEAAGWLVVMAGMQRLAFQQAEAFEAAREAEAAKRWYEQARAMQWMIDACGGMPQGEQLVIPPLDLAEGYGKAPPRPDEHLNTTLAELWASGLLERLVELGIDDATLAEMKRRMTGALHLAWARDVPPILQPAREQLEGVAS